MYAGQEHLCHCGKRVGQRRYCHVFVAGARLIPVPSLCEPFVAHIMPNDASSCGYFTNDEVPTSRRIVCTCFMIHGRVEA